MKNYEQKVHSIRDDKKTYLFGLKQNTYRKTDIIYRFSHAQKRRSIQVIQSLIMLTQDKQEI